MPVSSAPVPDLIHPTAIVHPNAQLHPTVRVGAYAVIGDQVQIGADTIVGHHAIIEGCTEIGERNQIFPGAAIGLESQDLKYVGGRTHVRIGNDNRIREYVTINSATADGEYTEIGNQNLLMAYVHVAHNCVIKDQVIVANSVALAGHVIIESQARISGVLGVHQFVHIGRLAMVGGMSRIERDVPPYMIVEGNPSRTRGLNRVGLERAGVDPDSQNLLKEAYRLLYHRPDLAFRDALEQLPGVQDNLHVQHLYEFLKASLGGEGRRGPVPGKG
ncbi:MAG: acyl-ACP--UDP-N-acetylglucosamine O-acyltransferase [Pseudanabaenaceae cyanobacterium]|jgi:UDP-N-acetylglucosamine acyltransferase